MSRPQGATVRSLPQSCRCAASSRLSQASIDRSLPLWGIERKRRNIYVELLAGRGHHAVGSGHETGRRGERHAAGIFEILARLEHRLLAHHAGAAHLLQAAVRVGDAPMARLELNGLAAAIGERDGIGPEEIAVLGRGTLGQEARGRSDLDLAGHGTIRGFGGIHRRAFSPNPGFLSRMSSTLVNSLSCRPATVAMTRLPSRAKAH